MFIDNKWGYVGIVATILFTVYSQVVIKWQMNGAHLPESGLDQIIAVVKMLLNPWVITSIFATLCAGVSWMFVMSKFDLSHAYPFVSLVYVFMMVASVIFFGEEITPRKMLGSIVVIAGILILVRG